MIKLKDNNEVNNITPGVEFQVKQAVPISTFTTNNNKKIRFAALCSVGTYVAIH